MGGDYPPSRNKSGPYHFLVGSSGIFISSFLAIAREKQFQAIASFSNESKFSH